MNINIVFTQLQPQKVSLYTLSTLASDNNKRMHCIKVDPEKFMKVVRPAIFHTPQRFILIKDGEPIPIADYTGYVLSSRQLEGQAISNKAAREVIA